MLALFCDAAAAGIGSTCALVACYWSHRVPGAGEKQQQAAAGKVPVDEETEHPRIEHARTRTYSRSEYQGSFIFELESRERTQQQPHIRLHSLIYCNINIMNASSVKTTSESSSCYPTTTINSSPSRTTFSPTALPPPPPPPPFPSSSSSSSALLGFRDMRRHCQPMAPANHHSGVCFFMSFLTFLTFAANHVSHWCWLLL